MDRLTKEYKALVCSGWRLFTLSHRAWSREMERHGLSPSTFPVVEMAVQQPGVTQQVIADALSVDKSCVSRAVKHLEDAGFLLREKAGERTRGLCCYPTEKARAAYEAIIAFEAKHIHALAGDVAPEKLANANASCIQLVERLISDNDK
ncbi:MAG: MarR family transcriptional regulator [Clostridia bacterium]|nr:MarR family transcriptional regulator [Clostridia bacterium]